MVMRPARSKAITPSRMPCSVASRSCSSCAISSSSRPKVRRLSRRAEQPRGERADRQRDGEPAGVGRAARCQRALETELSRMPTETSPTIAPSGPYSGALPLAERPVLPLSIPTWVSPVGGDDRLARPAADQRGVRVRVTDPVHVDDDDVGGAGLVWIRAGDLLDRLAHMPARRPARQRADRRRRRPRSAAMAAARCSYWRSSWVRSSCANSTKPTSTVAVRIASWPTKIWLESLRIASATSPPIVARQWPAGTRSACDLLSTPRAQCAKPE